LAGPVVWLTFVAASQGGQRPAVPAKTGLRDIIQDDSNGGTLAQLTTGHAAPTAD